MKIAFLIQAHKNYEQLKKNIDYLIKNEADVYVHIDQKSQELYKQLKSEYKMNKKVFIIDERIIVNWSGFSQVEATLLLMKKAIETSDYEYLNLISGQDLLIKKYSEFIDFLKQNRGKEFIEFEEIGIKEWRIKKYSLFRENLKNRTLYFRVLDNLIRKIQFKTLKRNNLNELNLYFGSSWFTLTGKAIKYILEKSLNKKFRDEFKYTSCPDEHYFQIILLNSFFKENCINNNLRYIDWHDCKNSPKTLIEKDFDRILINSNFIARKFDMDVNKKIIEKIFNEILICDIK